MSKSNKNIDIDRLTRYFSGELSAENMEEVLQWSEANEENNKEFRELKDAWDKLGSTSPGQHINIENEWQYFRKKVSTHQSTVSKPVWIPILKIAAAVLLIAGAAWYAIKVSGGETIKTELAETIERVLPDGSTITLNAGSKLYYGKDYGNTVRRVKLEGEAYFEVVSNPEKAFIIEMDGAELMVLGTSFNVRAYKAASKIEVIVTEGKVSVYDKKMPAKRVVAIGGEKAEFDKAEKIVKKTVNSNINYDSWKTRKIVFREESLPNIVDILSRVYYQKITIEDAVLNSCTLTTNFENKDFETVLHVLESTLGVTIVEKDGVILIYGPGC